MCNIFAFFVFPLLSCFLLKDHTGVLGIWASSYVIGPALMLLLIPAVNGKFSLSPARQLLLDETDTKASFSISLRNIDETINISERIQKFCNDNGVESRKGFLCSLCLEEMALIIFEQGYGSKPGEVDILVRIRNGNVLMRLRDNAPLTDVTKCFDACKEIKEDPAANIGIRIVMKSAESAVYSALFGTNNLLLRL